MYQTEFIRVSWFISHVLRYGINMSANVLLTHTFCIVPPFLTCTHLFISVGMSLSKFVIGVNTTELENFRAGFFDLQIRQIGFYNNANTREDVPAVVVDTLSKAEVDKRRPLLLKILLPISKLFFSEKANRRRSAMKLLQKRGFSRPRAILWGIKTRAAGTGSVPSLLKAAAIVGIDSFRAVLGTALKVCLFYPFVFLGKFVKFIKKRVFGMKVKELPSMT